MKDLFEELDLHFFQETQLELVSKKKQEYMNHLATLVIEGKGYLPSLDQPEEFEERELTPKEEDELYYRIGLYLNSLN